MRSTRLLVTLDVERDYGPEWRTPSAQSFASVTQALPRRFQPLCAAHGVRPTYLLSPEVLLSPDAVLAMAQLDDCELGTHLHSEYLPPGPRPATWCDQSLRIAAMQCELGEREPEQLATLTELFVQQFGRRPTSFRAGRFGAGQRTAQWLAQLGYTVDSSVTPGVAWSRADGATGPDYRQLGHVPYRVGDGNLWQPGRGPLLEVPVTIVPPATIGRGNGEPVWLRPWFSDRATLLAILDAAARDDDAGRPWHSLCVMFHSMELVAGASPYPQTESDVARYLDDLQALFARTRELGFASATLSEFERTFPSAMPAPATTAIAPAEWTVDRAPLGDAAVTLGGVDPAPVLAEHDVQPWFLYSFRHRGERWDNCLAYDFLHRHVAADAPVLDVGCGVGFNLFWLAERGHRNLFGCDVDAKAIAAARALAASAGIDARFWVDDGQDLQGVPQQRYGAIAAMNWMQLVQGFDLDAFVARAAALLGDGGVLVFDYIDRAYELHPDHRWLTSDWNKPESERRPSEYRTRFALPELQALLRRHGLEVEQHWHNDGPVPKGVLACRKVAVAAPEVAASPVARPRVLFVVDSPGWAHERKSANLIRYLHDRFDGSIVYQDRVAAADVDAADVVVLWYWRQVQSMQHLLPQFGRMRSKLLMGICSHNELEGEFRAPGLMALRRLPRTVFTHSELLEREYRPLVGGDSWCLPNGVDSTFFTPSPQPRAPGPLRVGWAGSVDNFGAQMRGLPDVLQPAVASLSGVELVIAAREERLRTQDEMRAFYQGLDVYACASRVEGTPNPCLEAAACGVPIVTTAVGNMPELIVHGENGLLLPRDTRAFAEAFAHLRDDAESRLAMGRQLRTTIEASWDWRHRAEGFAALFAAALVGGPVPSGTLREGKVRVCAS